MDKKEIEHNNGQPSMTIDKSWEIAFIGLEIGGTNLKAGIIGEDGKCSELKVERLAKDSSARQPKVRHLTTVEHIDGRTFILASIMFCRSIS